MLNLDIHTNMQSKDIIDMLRIVQMCDSNFPIGSFNHSFGMETYLRSGKINDINTMREWLDIFLSNQLVYSDALAIRMLYEYLKKNELDEIWKLDRLITVQSISKETRNGSKLIASRMTKIFLELYESEFVRNYENKIINGEVFGHPAIVFGLAMYTLKASEEEAIIFYMYSTVSTLIQNAVRAIPIGQKDGQLLIKEFSEKFKILYKKVENMDYSFFGCSTPGIELSQINHEVLDFRLFMS
ncbi:urease accessory protein UreF [Clostridium sp. CCUG 7971]|uniref:urease accessory protein UreF n=1 Tax=Clostridium sp. CCUG 7971 TaxID=2811414 RepID=UPI002570972C|nr:urease accessory protein UreF [Clostridium sp. CCUG 7971]